MEQGNRWGEAIREPGRDLAAAAAAAAIGERSESEERRIGGDD